MLTTGRALPAVRSGGPGRARYRRRALAVAAFLAVAGLPGELEAAEWRDTPLQSAILTSWEGRDGLPQITVQSMVQDPDGYLWLATQGGLVRFDGVRFQNHVPDDDGQLPSKMINTLLQARDTLYIGTLRGLAIRRDGRLAVVPLPADGSEPPQVHGLSQCPDGTIWAATSNGLFRGNHQRMQVADGVSRQHFSAVDCSGGVLRVGTPQGTVLVREDTRWMPMELPSTHHNAVVNVLRTTPDGLWVGTSRGLLLHAGKHWRPVAEGVLGAGSAINSLHADDSGQLLVGGEHGVARLRGRTLVDSLPVTVDNSLSSITAMLMDREGNLWLGSQVTGLHRLVRRAVQVNPLPPAHANAVVWSMAGNAQTEADGMFWVGTGNGVFAYGNGRFQSVVPAARLPHPHAYNMLAEHDRLWIGTRAGLVYVENPREGRPAVVRSDPRLAPLADAQIHALLRARDGALWIGTMNGLWRLDDDGLRNMQGGSGLPANVGVLFLLQIDDGAILAGSTAGSFRFEDDRAERVPLPDDRGEPRVDAIVQLPSGDIVHAMFDGRLMLQRGARVLQAHQAGTLHDSAVFHMSVLDDALWMSGPGGISKFALAELERFASGEIPAPTNQIVMAAPQNPYTLPQGSCCNGAGTSKGLLSGGMLHLPGRGGVFSVDPAALTVDRYPPKPRIERLTTSAGTVDEPGEHLIQLPRGVRDAAFDFTLLTLRNPGVRDLRYRLVGFDPDWREAEINQYRVHYTNLPPGQYRFEVTGSNGSGVAAEAPAVLSLSIPPLFSETPWRWVLLGGGSGLLMLLVLRAMQGLHRRREAQLEEKIQTRTRELREANAELERLSSTDALTGLHNRRHLGELLADDMACYARCFDAGRHADESVLVCTIDLDLFKSINDTWGHRAGDKVLRSVANRLRSALREGDQLARWGGEEFVIVTRPTPRVQVPALLDRISTSIRTGQHALGNGHAVRVTASIGAVEFPRFRAPWHVLLALADYAMYQIKNGTRDNWLLLRPADAASLSLDAMPGDLQAELAEGRVLAITGTRPSLAGDDDGRADDMARRTPADGNPP